MAFSGLISLSLVDWLLGLERVSWSGDGVLLGWWFELPAWAWVLIIGGCLVLAGWSYVRLTTSRASRVSLGLIRSALLVFLTVVLAGPMLVLKRERVEPDVLMVLVDRSGSMGIKDASVPGAEGDDPVSRTDAVRLAFERHGDLFGPDVLGRDRRIMWLGFDSRAYPIEAGHEGVSSLDNDSGRATAIRTAIDQAIEYASGWPISGVVLFSDGRSDQTTGPGLIRRLNQQAVGVFPVPLGADVQTVDLSLARVDAPDKAFVDDSVPVTVWVDRYPSDAEVDAQRVKVKLIDPQTGQTLDERSPGAEGLDRPFRLVGRSSVAGPTAWRVELVYEPSSGGSGDGAKTDLIPDNNDRQVELEMIDRPIRVLYVEGYPRWDYRYLQSVLVREESIRSSVLLVSADRGFAQEGDVPITRLPTRRW